MALAASVTVVVGGVEETGPIGGLVYAGAERTAVTDACTEWSVAIEWAGSEHSSRTALSFTLRRAPDAPPALLRDAELTLALPLGDARDWVINAPGNLLRADVAADALTEPVGIFSAGDTVGSPGIVVLSRRSAPETVVVWPLCATELGAMDLAVDRDEARLCIRTGLADRMAPGTELAWSAVHVDTVQAPWPAVRDRLADWYAELGMCAPGDAPEWLRRAHIYEAHVGFSVFAGGRRYERYPTVAALEADLERIRAIGFDVIQLMPRHPYPSYNVHDYADVTTTYGDEAEVRSLVAACHRAGMRVLLDVILHGVVDQEVVDETVASVHAGPYAARLGDGAIDYLSQTAEDVAWSRHIVEYAPYWRQGAPARHPLADAHPAWFMRDSAGRITRRYTKAFDIAHPGWGRYFLDSCVALVERLGIDGFRVDAPTYNQFATWAPGRAGRASDGALASLGLLRELRSRLRAVREDAAVYTEPTGVLFRAVADATYNYDEHWLVESLLGTPRPADHWRLVRTARELGRWLQDRDAALPPGATIVHHIDSHDSIWWRLPGAQWRRERFGRDAAVALLAAFSLLGGGFMTFMGGEDELDEELRRAHDLRRRLPELAGIADYESASASSDDVLVVLRAAGAHAALVAVNLTAAPVTCALSVRGRRLGPALHDAWNEEVVAVGPDDTATQVAFSPYQPRVLRLGAAPG